MDALPLNIIKIPNPHYKERNSRIDLIVIHAMGEWVLEKKHYYHCSDFLQKSGLSAHALCLPDGRIIECVDVRHMAFHAKAYNDRSIGIEFVIEGGHDLKSLTNRMENSVDPPYTKEQYVKGGLWIRQCVETFGLNAGHVTTHAALDPENKIDPGKAFDMDVILRILAD